MRKTSFKCRIVTSPDGSGNPFLRGLRDPQPDKRDAKKIATLRLRSA